MATDIHGGQPAAPRTDGGGGRRPSLWKVPAFITALILLIPLLGNHFVDGWNWSPGAFALLGILLFAIGVTYELVTRNVDTIAYRSAVGVALVSGFVLVWMNFVQLADDVNPAAAMYLLVPVLGTIGAGISRFHSNGMSRALFATALAQALVLVIALGRNPPVTAWTSAVWRGFGLNALIVTLFVGSALLFRTAAHGESAPGTA